MNDSLVSPATIVQQGSRRVKSPPRDKLDAERSDGRPDPRNGLPVNLPGLLQLEVLHQVDQEEEVVSPGQDLAGAPPLAHPEEDDLLVGDEPAGLGVDEALGAEGLGVLKVLGIVVPDVGAVEDLWGNKEVLFRPGFLNISSTFRYTKQRSP